MFTTCAWNDTQTTRIGQNAGASHFQLGLADSRLHIIHVVDFVLYKNVKKKSEKKNMKHICILSLIAKLIFLLQSSPSKFPFAGKDLDYTALSPLLYRYVMQFSWHCSSENFVFESKWENLLKILNKKKWTNMLKNTEKYFSAFILKSIFTEPQCRDFWQGFIHVTGCLYVYVCLCMCVRVCVCACVCVYVCIYVCLE